MPWIPGGACNQLRSLEPAHAEPVTSTNQQAELLIRCYNTSMKIKSPFPGMDPYLESRSIFPDFHDRFITHLSEAMQPAMPEPYYAALGRRAWVEVSERYIGPDVNVVLERATNLRSTNTATLEVAKPIVIKVPHDEIVEPLVEVYIGRGSQRRLVTAIELLSPGNKTPGERGRDLYLRKQQELLDSKTHLVELDFLRGGVHTTAVPEARLRRFIPEFTYHVCTHRWDQFEDYAIYPIGAQEVLPMIDIPLLPGDGNVSVDLQAVFERTYSAGPYHREMDYNEPLPSETAIG